MHNLRSTNEKKTKVDNRMSIHDPFASYDLPNSQDHGVRVLLEASSGNGNKRRRLSGDNDRKNSCDNENTRKNIIHRDVERHRRQEMAALYKALRFELPIQYLKGKRSVSDHMHEAVNYIKHLNGKIKELSDKRSQLRISSSTQPPDEANVNDHDPECFAGDHDDDGDTITVKPCLSGVEVVMSTLSRPRRVQKLTLSRVLKVLVAEGLSVVACVSTRVNHRLLHTIESEVMFADGKDVDVFALQQKLTKMVEGFNSRLFEDLIRV